MVLGRQTTNPRNEVDIAHMRVLIGLWGKKCKTLPLSSRYRVGKSYLENIIYEKLKADICDFCNILFSIGEYGFGTRRIVCFYNISRRYTYPEEN